jgi:GDP-mannose pyrophosphatase NudK
MNRRRAVDELVRNEKSTLLSDNWGKLRRHEFELCRRDGQWQHQVREVYDRGNAAVILLVDPDRGTVVLTRQFRFPVYLEGDNPLLIEACAGLLDGDAPEACARKEAEEETGYRVGAVTHLFDSYMSPGSVKEKLSFFVGTYDPASRVSDGGGLEHEGEDIEVMELPLEAALAMVRTGEIVDAKTIMLLQHVAMGGGLAANRKA